MLIEKVKTYFEKYPELKILFFFDPREEYKDEIIHWADDSIYLIKAGRVLFGLKYQLEYELKDKKVFLYFNYPQPSGDERKLFPLMDVLNANRILQIDDVEDFIEQYELKPYQRELVKKYIGYLKNKKVQKTLSKILKADSFDDENQIRKGLICHFLGLSSIEDETIILAKLFTSLLQKNKGLFSVYDRIKEIDGEFYLCKLIDEYFDIKIAKLEEDKILLAIKKLKYNLILQNVGSPLPNDNYSKLKSLLK